MGQDILIVFRLFFW